MRRRPDELSSKHLVQRVDEPNVTADLDADERAGRHRHGLAPVVVEHVDEPGLGIEHIDHGGTGTGDGAEFEDRAVAADAERHPRPRECRDIEVADPIGRGRDPERAGAGGLPEQPAGGGVAGGFGQAGPRVRRPIARGEGASRRRAPPARRCSSSSMRVSPASEITSQATCSSRDQCRRAAGVCGLDERPGLRRPVVAPEVGPQRLEDVRAQRDPVRPAGADEPR